MIRDMHEVKTGPSCVECRTSNLQVYVDTEEGDVFCTTCAWDKASRCSECGLMFRAEHINYGRCQKCASENRQPERRKEREECNLRDEFISQQLHPPFS